MFESNVKINWISDYFNTMSGLDGVINFNFDQIGDLDEDQIPMPMDVLMI